MTVINRLLVVSIIILIGVSQSFGWQQPANSYGPQEQVAAYPDSVVPSMQGYAPTAPPKSGAGAPDPQSVQSGAPQYPYPPHHNPYYTGQSPLSSLGDTLQWIATFPVNVADQVADFLDKKIFNKWSATPAGPSQSQVTGPESPKINETVVTPQVGTTTATANER